MGSERTPSTVLLIVPGERDVRHVCALLGLDPWRDFRCLHVASVDEALQNLGSETIDLVFVDLDLPGGLDDLVAIQSAAFELPLIALTSNDDPEHVLEARRLGAQDCLTKPHLSANSMVLAVHGAVEAKELQLELEQARIEAQSSAWYQHEANQKLRETQEELSRINEQLERQATTDPLTGLYNRRHGRRVLGNEVESVKRGYHDLSVIMLDLDHFKHINDTHGHDGGDAVLVEVSSRLQEAVRAPDTVVRWGGEEVLVVCPSTDREGVLVLAERLRTSIAMAPVSREDGAPIPVTASLGVATALGADEDSEALVKRCDLALYAAKEQGRDQVVCLDEAGSTPTPEHDRPTA